MRAQLSEEIRHAFVGKLKRCKCDFPEPIEKWLGVPPKRHFTCHAGLYICRYIMYGFSMQNVL